MHVVGHQHEGVQGAAVLQCGLAQLLALVQVIAIIREARLPIVAALHDVLRDTG
jgi:hypothetical protein